MANTSHESRIEPSTFGGRRAVQLPCYVPPRQKDVALAKLPITVATHLVRSWHNVPDDLRKEWECPFCFFLLAGVTNVPLLEAGVHDGMQCCTIILDAVKTWEKLTGSSLDKAQIFPWRQGYDNEARHDSMGSSILLQWPVADGNWNSDSDVLLNLFRPEGNLVILNVQTQETSLIYRLKEPSPSQKISLHILPFRYIVSHQVTLLPNGR